MSSNNFGIDDKTNINNSIQINSLNIGTFFIQNNVDTFNLNNQNKNNFSNYIPKLNNIIYQNNKNKNNKSLIFKNNNFNYKNDISYQLYSLKEILEKSDIICKNQSGCRYLEKKIDENPEIALSIFPNIKSKINGLMFDAFGNYFIQKLIEYININQINEILTYIISHNFLEICLNQHGTRVIQKLIERIYNNNLLLEAFNNLLIPNLYKIFIDQNATHIIIKYMSLIPFPANKNIIYFIQKNILSLSTHKHSVCTLQKAIQSLDNPQRKILLMNIAKISNKLFNDQFGNYVVQFALSMNDGEVNTFIINNYLKDFKNNCCRKYSSNVFEKCFEYSNYEIKQMIIINVCTYSNVRTLLYDIYGNYVLQQIIKESSEPYKTYFLKFIISLIDGLKNFPYGPIIFQKLVTNFPIILNYVNIQPNNYK